MKVKLGSLFDGIGGFPLAGFDFGIEPIWASEIEPFPIKVTQIRFPNMQHVGDITKLNGAELEPVDIITGGSPCQDLSVAGKRAGLEGARSGLFMEQVRIIKEMRNAEKLRNIRGRNAKAGDGSYSSDKVAKRGLCGDIRPRFMVWENVPGAFSSAGGEDFRAVIEETARIAETGVSIPRPADGKWAGAGCIMADGWSIAWRVLDAQFWGVPQRRRRIFLVADFGGQSAPEILFKHESLSGNTSESGTQGEGTAEGAEGGIGKTKCYDIGEARLRTPQEYIEKTPSITSRCGTGGNNVPAVVKTAICLNDQGGQMMDVSDVAGTLRREAHGHEPAVYCLQGNGIDRADTAGCNGKGWTEDVGYTLNTLDRPEVAPICMAPSFSRRPMQQIATNQEDISYAITTNEPPRVYALDRAAFNQGISSTVSAKWAKQSGGPSGDEVQNLAIDRSSVRRLTPLECERLQGFPDGWTDIEKATDSARYKALGNSVAIPCVKFVLQGIAEEISKGGN